MVVGSNPTRFTNIKMKHVKITKLSETNKGLVTGYTVYGKMLHPPEIGRSLNVIRYRTVTPTEDKSHPGIFITSPVVEILPNGIKTNNSIYEIEELPEE